MDKIRLAHNESDNRYELYVGDDLVCVCDYRPSDGVLIFDHTETSMAYRGRGLADKLVCFALDDVASKGLTVVPQCWFVADVIEANPKYAPLLAA